MVIALVTFNIRWVEGDVDGDAISFDQQFGKLKR